MQTGGVTGDVTGGVTGDGAENLQSLSAAEKLQRYMAKRNFLAAKNVLTDNVFPEGSTVESINANFGGTTLLHSLVSAGEVKPVQEVLKISNAKLNIQEKSGDTPVLLAARCGKWNIVDELLKDKRTDLSCVNKQGATLLRFAVSMEKSEIVSKLIKAGVYPHRDNDGVSDLDCLLMGSEAAKIVATTRGPNGKTLLHAAAEKRDKKLLRKLLKMDGIDVNSQDNSGATALHYAVTNNSEESVKALLKVGANPGVTDNGGRKPATCDTYDVDIGKRGRVLKLLNEAEGRFQVRKTERLTEGTTVENGPGAKQSSIQKGLSNGRKPSSGGWLSKFGRKGEGEKGSESQESSLLGR